MIKGDTAMIKETIFKADYQPVTIINEQRSKLMFQDKNKLGSTT